MSAIQDPELVRTALAPWVAGKLEEAAGHAVHDVRLGPLMQPPSGQSSDTGLFSVQWSDRQGAHSADYVLRRQPTDRQLFLDADVLREYRIIQALDAHSGVPVPDALWAEPTGSVLGAPCFVMSKVEGTVPFGKPSVYATGWLPTLTPAQRGAVWSAGIDLVGAVHASDVGHMSACFSRPDGRPPDLDRHLDDFVRWYRWAAKDRAYPVTDAAIDYLTGSRPSLGDQPPVFCWGDARLGNMVFAEDLTVAAALDWELATIGPNSLDIGHWLFFEEFYTDACGVAPLEGIPGRAATIARYERASGLGVTAVEYFEVMAGTMLAITLIRQADILVEQGLLEPTTRMGSGNTVTQILARRLGLTEPELDSDFLARRRMMPRSQQ